MEIHTCVDIFYTCLYTDRPLPSYRGFVAMAMKIGIVLSTVYQKAPICSWALAGSMHLVDYDPICSARQTRGRREHCNRVTSSMPKPYEGPMVFVDSLGRARKNVCAVNRFRRHSGPCRPHDYTMGMGKSEKRKGNCFNRRPARTSLI